MSDVVTVVPAPNRATNAHPGGGSSLIYVALRTCHWK